MSRVARIAGRASRGRAQTLKTLRQACEHADAWIIDSRNRTRAQAVLVIGVTHAMLDRLIDGIGRADVALSAESYRVIERIAPGRAQDTLSLSLAIDFD